ncbi:Cu(I)-responsive transcriptional regulator [Algihabitans albus]|uniref:Cu(I)-responsive transcriptional regulator n=1 Tax=Algihabitans albus TaxID=2164067 RepID=UPI000E5D0F94|nr:Cu(I)-responsive transcriptional regulator [Algihabitans albus]
MNIGEAAVQSGVAAKTIRYYESIGLIAPAERTAAGYRIYGTTDVQTLRFVARARGLGFSVADCASLLALWRDKSRASADVKALARHQVETIEAKIAELETMRATLEHLVERCHGDDRPDCPIISDLAGALSRRDT